MNQEEYEMIYSQKQQCYTCDQLNHITLNYKALAVLINAEKMHQASYKDWFVDFENDLKQIRISISNENLWVNEIKSFLQKMKNAQWFVNNNNFNQQQLMKVK